MRKLFYAVGSGIMAFAPSPAITATIQPRRMQGDRRFSGYSYDRMLAPVLSRYRGKSSQSLRQAGNFEMGPMSGAQDLLWLAKREWW